MQTFNMKSKINNKLNLLNKIIVEISSLENKKKLHRMCVKEKNNH